MSAVLTSRTFTMPISVYTLLDRVRCERESLVTYDMCICHPRRLYPCNIDFCIPGGFRLEDAGELEYIVIMVVVDRDYDKPCQEQLRRLDLWAVIGLNLHHVMVSEPEA